jgi:hypothetical protein
LRDRQCAAAWSERGIDVSQALELSLCSIRTTARFSSIHASFPCGCFPFTFSRIMASRRACVSVLRSSEAYSSKSTCASSSLRKFSSRASTFAYPSPRANAPSQRSLISSKSPKPTLQLLQARQFSSTPTPHHGHLDEPKPGEESVPTQSPPPLTALLTTAPPDAK